MECFIDTKPLRTVSAKQEQYSPRFAAGGIIGDNRPLSLMPLDQIFLRKQLQPSANRGTVQRMLPAQRAFSGQKRAPAVHAVHYVVFKQLIKLSVQGGLTVTVDHGYTPRNRLSLPLNLPVGL